jgi:hypothetical protein
MTLPALPLRIPVLAGLLVVALALALVLGAAGCAGTLTDPWAFETQSDSGAGDAPTVDVPSPSCPDIPTKLATSCGAAGCHDATTKAEALDLVSPGVASRLVGVPAVEGAGLLIDPSTPSKSVVYTKLLATPPFGARMPTGGSLDDATIQCVLEWVTTVAGSGSAAADGGPSSQPFDGAAGDAAAGDTGSVAAFTTIRLAAGQTSPVTDAKGQTWIADADFTGGTPTVQSPAIAIAATDSPSLYNGQRYGNPSFSYQFTVPNGAYSVTLKFAELYVTAAGMRLFDVVINGTNVETGFDIYATAGAMNTAVDRSYAVTVTGGQIQVDFNQGSIQFPKVDAIQIAPAAASDGGP